METNRILADLRAERDRLDQAIAALEALNPTGSTPVRRGRPAKSPAAPKAARGGRRQISAAGRARIAEAARKMWEQRRKKTGAGRKSASAKTAVSKKSAPVRQMSEAARKRISEAARKRWAEQRKAAAKTA